MSADRGTAKKRLIIIIIWCFIDSSDVNEQKLYKNPANLFIFMKMDFSG